MELLEKVKDLTSQLRKAQSELLIYCQTSTDPLSYRFKIWDQHIHKLDHAFVSGGGSEILEALFDQWCIDYEPSRNETIGWSYLYDTLLRDYSENPQRYNSILTSLLSTIRQKRIASVLEDQNYSTTFKVPSSEEEFEQMLQTELIKTNFGSFCYAW